MCDKTAENKKTTRLIRTHCLFDPQSLFYEFSFYFQERKQDILINTQNTELNIRVQRAQLF